MTVHVHNYETSLANRRATTFCGRHQRGDTASKLWQAVLGGTDTPCEGCREALMAYYGKTGQI